MFRSQNIGKSLKTERYFLNPISNKDTTTEPTEYITVIENSLFHVNGIREQRLTKTKKKKEENSKQLTRIKRKTYSRLRRNRDSSVVICNSGSLLADLYSHILRSTEDPGISQFGFCW